MTGACSIYRISARRCRERVGVVDGGGCCWPRDCSAGRSALECLDGRLPCRRCPCWPVRSGRAMHGGSLPTALGWACTNSRNAVPASPRILTSHCFKRSVKGECSPQKTCPHLPTRRTFRRHLRRIRYSLRQPPKVPNQRPALLFPQNSIQSPPHPTPSSPPPNEPSSPSSPASQQCSPP